MEFQIVQELIEDFINRFYSVAKLAVGLTSRPLHHDVYDVDTLSVGEDVEMDGCGTVDDDPSDGVFCAVIMELLLLHHFLCNSRTNTLLKREDLFR